MNMKRTIRLLGIVIASIALVACSGGGSDPVKTEKVWKLVEKIEPGTFGPVKTTFEYDGSGKLIKQNNINSGDHVKFNYDDNGLTTRDDFYESGKIKFHIEFDSHGEMILRSKPDASGLLMPEITYINTYDDRVISGEAPKRKVEETDQGDYARIYPTSKLVTRKRGGGDNWFERYSYEGNKVMWKIFNTSVDTVVIKEFENEFNKEGDFVSRVHDFDGAGPRLPRIDSFENIYTPDGNGNVSKRVQTDKDGNIFTTTYEWEQMDIPVQ